MKTIVIGRTWDDRELPASEHVTVRLSIEAQRVKIWVDAPFHDGPAPNCDSTLADAAPLEETGPIGDTSQKDDARNGRSGGARGDWVAGRSTPRLWEHEVVEVFFLGADDKYLEVELGPSGHYLVLLLEGRRNIAQQGIVIHCRARIDAQRWHGEASFPTSLLPKGFARLNATAIWGQGAKRTYAMWRPCLGSEPDFHALSVFAPFGVPAHGDSKLPDA